MAGHMLSYHQMLGDKKIVFGIFLLFQVVTLDLCLVMGAAENFYTNILFIYIVEGLS
jgi:hypothetical protein